MDVYDIWCNLLPGTSDLEFCAAVDRSLGVPRTEGRICGHRLTRRKLGLGPRELGEFHIEIELEGRPSSTAPFAKSRRAAGRSSHPTRLSTTAPAT